MQLRSNLIAVCLLALAILLSSCATSRSGSGSSSGPAGSPATPSGSGTAPIPDKVINVAGSCKQVEEDGFREDATLVVQNNEVRSVEWQLWVGKRGSCKFAGGDFTQRQSRPHIELIAKDGSGCKLMVWQEPRRVTLAHNGCQKHCTKGVYEEAWPVMFDPASGACAKER